MREAEGFALHYPPDEFPPLSRAEVAVLRETGLLDRVAAMCARHVAQEIAAAMRSLARQPSRFVPAGWAPYRRWVNAVLRCGACGVEKPREGSATGWWKRLERARVVEQRCPACRPPLP